MNALTPSRRRGFTLVELVLVIVIAGIIGTVTGAFITKPMEGYVNLARRAELTDAAESGLRLMAEDLRRALPKSVRITGNYLEMINTVDAGRYRAVGNPQTSLDFAAADTSFNIVGRLGQLGAGNFTGRAVIYHQGIAGADAYTDAAANGNTGVISQQGSIAISAVGNEDRIVLPVSHRFTFQSPKQRVFFVDGPVSYRCDTGNRQLLRYTGYGYQTNQPTTFGGITGVPVTRHIAACSFTSNPATGLVTLRLTLQDYGETVVLLRQIHVDNAP